MIVDADKFQVAVSDIIEDYADAVNAGIDEAIEEVADHAVDKLKTAGDFNGTKFRRAWTKTVETSRTGISKVTVHLRKPYYRIGHLLEFGHATRNGGRTRAFNFIAPVAQEAEKELETKIAEKVKKA